MSASAYAEAIWEAVPEGRVPERFALRRSYLLDHVRAGERVLDVGCGEGHFTEALADAGCQVTGVDVARIPLQRAKRRRAGLDLRLLEARGPWPLADASFDVIWAGEVIEHVVDTGAFLSEIRRLLRPAGSLLISTPAHPPLALICLALSPRRFAEHFDVRADHLRFYNRTALRALLADFRFTDIEIRAAGGLPLARPLLLARARRERF
jgi:2-polyprenyl-6-hydroxyphenyl methylase/3-demethylubiquinone-9 3-methyltransferase